MKKPTRLILHPLPAEQPEKRPRPSFMARAASTFPVLLILLTAMIVLAAPSPLARDRQEQSATLSATSYTRIINQGFIPLNWLVRVEDPVTGEPGVALSAEAAANPDVLRFVRGSYLGQDLASAAPGLWRFEGGRLLSINPNVHNLQDPFAWQGGWRGNLSFRDGASDAEQLGDPYLILTAGSGDSLVTRELLLSSLYRHQHGDDGGVVAIDTAEASGITDRGFAFRDNQENVVATLSMIGNRPVILIRCDGSRTHEATITTAGHAPRSCQSRGSTASQDEERVSYPLSDEDRIVFRMRGNPNPVLTAQLAYGRSFISRHRAFGARIINPELHDLAQEISQAMGWAVGRDGWGSEYGSRSIALTLDRAMQADVESKLRTYVDELRAGLGRSEDDLFPAAVTVMDASNGELLALGSFPTPDLLEERPDLRFSSLARNQNFVALPIGSAAKVPVATAILGRFPDLRNLCISGTALDPADGGKRRIHTILGIELSDSIGDLVGDGMVDFDRFLRKSSNRFGAALIVLAAARTDPVRDTQGIFAPLGPTTPRPLAPLDVFSLRVAGEACPGTRRYGQAPAYVFRPIGPTTNFARRYLGVEGLPMRLRDLQRRDGDGSEQSRASWIDWLEHHFGMDAVAGETGPPIYDAMIWQPILGGGNRDHDLDRFFASVSPDRERFGLGSAQRVRDYVMVMLGGGNARWTTVKLAEAYARIVSGRAINARLVVDDQPSQQRLEFWPVRPEVRDALLSGMSQAAGGDGTASRVGAALNGVPVPPGQVFRVFAKTGTPAVAQPDRSPINRLVNTLIQSRILVMRQGRLEVAVRRSETPQAALPRLAADRRLPYSNRRTEEVLAAIAAINAARAQRGNGGLQFGPNETLTGLSPDLIERRANEAPEGGVVVFVVGRYCASDVKFTSPLRTLSVAINIQARTQVNGGSGPNPAAILAERLLVRNGSLISWLRSEPATGRRTCSN
ncbi:MAG TPA: hypothetical protein VEC11_08485 [Allosphingosinicella sp.]|nr:hypothetical protein [Allosphingosinicella sp.]